MKRIILILGLLVLVVAGLSQCTAYRSSVYEEKMVDLRSQVQIGDNIYEAAKKIEGRYHYISGPLDLTKLDKELWLHVNFGLQPTFIETVTYASDVELQFGDHKPISAVIKADSDGVVTSIE